MPKGPVDDLRGIAAPTDLIEWVRKLAPDTAERSAWVDAPRADWIPYLAVLRGIQRDTILRATCECAVELAGTTLAGPEADRVLAVLRDGAARGRDAFATTDADLKDLRFALIANGTQPQVTWMYWAELVLELARASSRGNPLVGISLALRTLASAKHRGNPNQRRAHLDLVARLRDKLTAAT
ncbi:MAG: hypothetical protein ABI867_15150 [Kofleriaceae bacterium]